MSADNQRNIGKKREMALLKLSTELVCCSSFKIELTFFYLHIIYWNEKRTKLYFDSPTTHNNIIIFLTRIPNHKNWLFGIMINSRYTTITTFFVFHE